MINRLLLVAVCVMVVFSGSMALGQYFVASPVPVAVFRPVPAVVPVTTYYAPAPPVYGPVVTYSPVALPPPVAYTPPIAYATPIAYPTPIAVYPWPGAVVRTKVYVSGQPVRNVLRAVAP